jgi:hypothetical protein
VSGKGWSQRLRGLALYCDANRPKRPKCELRQHRAPFESSASRLKAIPIQAVCVP